jgi:Ni,Fe-hydrogenase I small subunit
MKQKLYCLTVSQVAIRPPYGNVIPQIVASEVLYIRAASALDAIDVALRPINTFYDHCCHRKCSEVQRVSNR